MEPGEGQTPELLKNTDAYAALHEVLNTQENKFPGRRWALLSDIDDTLRIWQQAEPRVEKNSVDLLNRRLTEGHWGKICSTGRKLPRIIDFIRKGEIFIPHAVNTNVCGPIYTLKPEALSKPFTEITEQDYSEDINFTHILEKNFNKREKIEELQEYIAMMAKNPDFGHFDLRFPNQLTDNFNKYISDNPYSLSLVYDKPNTGNPHDSNPFKKYLEETSPGLTVIFSRDQSDPAKQRRVATFYPWGKDLPNRHMIDQGSINGGIIAGDGGNDAQALFSTETGPAFWRTIVGKDNYDGISHYMKGFKLMPGKKFLHRSARVQPGEEVVFYVEPDVQKRQGPDSVLQAVRMADLAWAMKDELRPSDLQEM